MSLDQAWRRFAQDVGGRVASEETGWWIFKYVKEKVVVPVGRWSLTLDDPDKGMEDYNTYTRMEAQYQGGRRFRFKVCRAGFFRRLWRWLGAQDIETGDSEFDHQFIVKGSDEESVRRLFSSADLRQLVRRALHNGRLEIKSPSSLYFEEVGTIKDAQRLIDLHKLFEETLNQLVRIDSSHDPGSSANATRHLEVEERKSRIALSLRDPRSRY